MGSGITPLFKFNFNYSGGKRMRKVKVVLDPLPLKPLPTKCFNLLYNDIIFLGVHFYLLCGFAELPVWRSVMGRHVLFSIFLANFVTIWCPRKLDYFHFYWPLLLNFFFFFFFKLHLITSDVVGTAIQRQGYLMQQKKLLK